MAGLVFKLLLKATVPLAIMVGVLSYGLYAHGGNPIAVLKRVAGGAFEEFKDTGRNMQEGAGRLVSQDESTPSTRHQRFYTWVDDAGVTHYSSEAPAGDAATADAATVSVDSERNLVRAVSAPPATAGVARPAGPDVAARGSEARIPAAGPPGRPGLVSTGPASRAGGNGEFQSGSRSDAQLPHPDASDTIIPGMAGIALPDGAERRQLLELLR